VSRPTAAPTQLQKRLEDERPGRRWPGALLIAVAATGLACITTFPLVLHLGSSIYGEPGDATGGISIFWWWAYAVEHGKPLLDNTMWGAPFGAGWSRQPFAVLQLLLFTPLSVLLGPTVAYNLGVLSSFPLSAVFTYLLARRLRIGPLPASFSALAFTFLPYHQEKATGHMFQAHMELFPALLWLLLRWRQGGSRWNLVGAGAVLGLGIWIDYQFALILLFLTAVFFLVSLLAPHPVTVGLVARLRQHAVAVPITGAAVLPFLPPAVLLAVRPGSGGAALSLAQRSLDDIDIYSVRPWEYLMPWRVNPLVPQAVRDFQAQHLHGSNGVEQAQVLGYSVIALALVAIIWFRPRFPVVLGVAVAAAGAALALPAHLHVFNLTLLGPAALLNHGLPFIRVYARFGVLVMLGATLLAGLGLATLHTGLDAHRLGWLAAAPFLVLALEFNRLPPTYTTTLFPAPEEYRWLRDQPSGTLIEYPLLTPTNALEAASRQYTLYQQVHLHPLFNGATPGSRADVVAPSLNPYYAEDVAARLRSLGIRYVFVHRGDYLGAGYGLPQAVIGLRYLGSFDNGNVDAFLVE